jgi:toxin ParE1/3/4
MDLIWLPEARLERRSQLAYIASKDPMAAIAVGLRLRNAVEKLTVFPNADRPGRRAGTRELVVTGTSLIVIYAVNEGSGEVQILGIVHAKQKYPPQ